MKKIGKIVCVFALITTMTSSVLAEDKVETYLDDNGCVVTTVNGEITDVNCDVEIPGITTFDLIFPWG